MPGRGPGNIADVEGGVGRWNRRKGKAGVVRSETVGSVHPRTGHHQQPPRKQGRAKMPGAPTPPRKKEKKGREGERERGREGERERGREGERERGREGEREGGREGERERGREGERERGREGERERRTCCSALLSDPAGQQASGSRSFSLLLPGPESPLALGLQLVCVYTSLLCESR